MAFSGTLLATTLSAQGQITKGADADISVDLPHGLGVIPVGAIISAISGTEVDWKVSAMDNVNVTLTASNGAGTANSVCSVVVLKTLHSIIK